jgi:hypothetical protein
MTLSGQTHTEYMRKYRINEKEKRRVNRENTLEALKASEKALMLLLNDAPLRLPQNAHTALSGVRRAIQVLEDNVKL